MVVAGQRSTLAFGAKSLVLCLFPVKWPVYTSEWHKTEKGRGNCVYTHAHQQCNVRFALLRSVISRTFWEPNYHRFILICRKPHKNVHLEANQISSVQNAFMFFFFSSLFFTHRLNMSCKGIYIYIPRVSPQPDDLSGGKLFVGLQCDVWNRPFSGYWHSQMMPHFSHTWKTGICVKTWAWHLREAVALPRWNVQFNLAIHEVCKLEYRPRTISLNGILILAWFLGQPWAMHGAQERIHKSFFHQCTRVNCWLVKTVGLCWGLSKDFRNWTLLLNVTSLPNVTMAHYFTAFLNGKPFWNENFSVKKRPIAQPDLKFAFQFPSDLVIRKIAATRTRLFASHLTKSDLLVTWEKMQCFLGVLRLFLISSHAMELHEEQVLSWTEPTLLRNW